MNAIDTQTNCDRCMRGHAVWELLDEQRWIISCPGEMCSVMVCERCYEKLGRPAAAQVSE